MFINEDYERIKKEIENRKSVGHRSMCFWAQNPKMLNIDPTEKYRYKISDEIIERLKSDGYIVTMTMHSLYKATLVTIQLKG